MALKEASTPVQSKRPAPWYELRGHKQAISNFVFLHDDVHIVSGSVDGTIRKWNCDTGQVVGEPWEGEGGDIHALALSPDGRVIACGRVNGSVQRWNTDGMMIEDVWTNHNKAVRSLSWSPCRIDIASGSDDGTILIRNARSGKIEVGPIKTEQEGVESLAYSPSGDKIASGGFNTICIWNARTGELVVGPTKDLGNTVTSLVWSSDSTKLYSAAGSIARVFDSKSGELLHSFQHDSSLWSVALSPKRNVLACVGNNGVAQLWDIESHKPLGRPFHQEHHGWLLCVSFSRDGRYVAYGGDYGLLTVWMVKDIAPQSQPGAPTLLEKRDKQNTKQETWPNSPLSSRLDADATGGGGFVEEAHDDLYDNFFQSSQQSLLSPSPGFHFPSLFSALRFLNVISQRCSLPDESVPKERSKRGFLSRLARSNSSLELATVTSDQPVPERKVGEGEREQDENVDHCGSSHDSLSARKDKGKQLDDFPDTVQSLPSYDRTRSYPDSKDDPNLWEQLMQTQGINLIFSFLYPSTRLANAPQPRITRNPWWWNSSSFLVGPSKHSDDIAACRDEDRYGIAPESDAEAAAAMLHTNNDAANNSTQPGQPAVVAQTLEMIQVIKTCLVLCQEQPPEEYIA